MRIATILFLFILAGCYNGEDSTGSSASASLDPLFRGGDKGEKKKAPGSKSTGTLMTLMDLLNDTPFGAEDYLSKNGYSSVPASVRDIKTYRFKHDTLFSIDKSCGKEACDRYVTYSFPKKELYEVIKAQAEDLGFKFSQSKTDQERKIEIYASESHEMQLWSTRYGLYGVLVRKK